MGLELENGVLSQGKYINNKILFPWNHLGACKMYRYINNKPLYYWTEDISCSLVLTFREYHANDIFVYNHVSSQNSYWLITC